MRRLFRWALDAEKGRQLAVLSRVTLFAGLSQRFLRKLLTDLFLKEYEESEVIFAEGDLGMAVYIVIEGSVTIAKRSDGGEVVLARIGPGGHFGELALIDHSPRFASAVAGEKTLLLIMYRSYFENLLQSHNLLSSRILHNLLGLMIRYVRRTQGQAETPSDTLADV
jgi:CRP-like cAMP-binding protein